MNEGKLGSRSEAMKAGALDFIGKPYDGEVLVGTVRCDAHETDEQRGSEKARIQGNWRISPRAKGRFWMDLSPASRTRSLPII